MKSKLHCFLHEIKVTRKFKIPLEIWNSLFLPQPLHSLSLSLSLKHTYNTKALEANLETKAPEKRVETHTIVAKKKNNRKEPKVFKLTKHLLVYPRIFFLKFFFKNVVLCIACNQKVTLPSP